MTEEKKSVLGFLKGLVAEEVPDRSRPAPTTATTEAQEHAHAPAHATTSPTAPVLHAAAPDAQALAKLEARVQGALPPAYATFMETYESLREDIPDERTRFRVALKTSHTTADQVYAAIDQLIGVMDAARAEFSRSFEENKSRRVGEAQRAIFATEAKIASGEAELKALQEGVAALRAKRDADTQGMQAETERLEEVRAGFESAHAQVFGRLAAHKNNVANMLSSTTPKGTP